MGRELLTRADGSTVDLALQDAEQADITAKAKRVVQVNSSGTAIKSVRTRENISGSAGTGSDGDANRVYTLTTAATSIDILELFLDGVLLVEGSQYSKDNSLKTVTIIGNCFDSQTLSVFFYQ